MTSLLTRFMSTQKFINEPSLGGATLCHDALDHHTGLCATFPMKSKGAFLVVLLAIIQKMYVTFGKVTYKCW